MGSCNNRLVRRALRRFSTLPCRRCLVEGVLQGLSKDKSRALAKGVLEEVLRRCSKGRSTLPFGEIEAFCLCAPARIHVVHMQQDIDHGSVSRAFQTKV